MCGIFGLFAAEDSLVPVARRRIVEKLLLLSESRGREASGLACARAGRLEVCKDSCPASRLIKTPAYRKFAAAVFSDSSPLAVIGHTRLATNGSPAHNNNCPIVAGDIAGVHNGIVVNDESIRQEFPRLRRDGLVDSEVVFRLLELFAAKGPGLEEAAREVYRRLEGASSIAAISSSRREAVLATNTGSLYFCAGPGRFIFASERPMLEKLVLSLRGDERGGMGVVTRLEPGEGCRVDLCALSTGMFRLPAGPDVMPAGRTIPSGHGDEYPAQEAMDRIRRCARCILPATMPFIEFDADGVCNYCRAYSPIKVYGEAALRALVEKYRSPSGGPDCMVAFSGGRDSSYGLHYVKKVLGMNPVAFTYDWGMVADIGRRNQSRMTGRLGVEHVVCSADIPLRRRFIRENIKAWLRRPHLGMVPLFMAGDKPAEYYVTKAARAYGIKLVFLCRGNELETTEYKFGFLGVRNSEPRGVMHEMPLGSRVTLALSAIRQYILNPAYFNASAPDILFGYYVTCVMPLDFVYLWHYVKWDETLITSTLMREYGWETERDTALTWRTDDGTSPFYNYIYCTVAGFTENDAFRSNQIREGVLSREEALKLVREENRPRFGAIRDYLGKVGLDYREVMAGIERIPKFYQ